jgi:hypothetical protein
VSRVPNSWRLGSSPRSRTGHDRRLALGGRAAGPPRLRPRARPGRGDRAGNLRDRRARGHGNRRQRRHPHGRSAEAVARGGARGLKQLSRALVEAARLRSPSEMRLNRWITTYYDRQAAPKTQN